MRIAPPRDRRERTAALARLLGETHRGEGSDRVAEALALADAGAIDLSGLVAAWDHDEAIGAALFTIAGDGSAFVWPPEVRDWPDRDAVAVRLLEDVLARAEAAGSRFAQVAIETERLPQRHDLERAGFRYLTDLLYLQRPLDSDLPPAAAIDGRTLTFSPQSEDRFADLIGRTYIDSRDCPAFADARTPAEALRSYRDAGTFTPERWQLLESAGRDAAVVLVNDHPDEAAREIVYLGVVPEARRAGLAGALVARVLAEARRDGCESVICAVDAANVPAVAFYDRLGFFPVARRAVYLRRFGDRDGSRHEPC